MYGPKGLSFLENGQCFRNYENPTNSSRGVFLLHNLYFGLHIGSTPRQFPLFIPGASISGDWFQDLATLGIKPESLVPTFDRHPANKRPAKGGGYLAGTPSQLF
jgi:hypothetical protein